MSPLILDTLCAPTLRLQQAVGFEIQNLSPTSTMILTGARFLAIANSLAATSNRIGLWCGVPDPHMQDSHSPTCCAEGV